MRSEGKIIIGRQQRSAMDRFFVCLVETYEQLADEFVAGEHDPIWMATKIAEAEAKEKHAQELEVWWQNREEEHELELAVKRKERQNAILQRLSDLGWAKEIEHERQMNGLSRLHQFRIGTQAKKLTEKDWDDLKPKLEGVLQEVRNARLEKELYAKWTQRYFKFQSLLQAEYDKLPFNTVGPSIADLADLPQFQEKLFLPIEHELAQADLADLILQLPEIRTQWVRSREEELIELLKENDVDTTAGREVLHYAVNVFSCNHCSSSCVYPRPLMHQCSRYKPESDYRNSCLTTPWPSLLNYMEATDSRVWGISCFTIRKGFVKVAQDVISAVGLPASATMADVRKTDGWIVCPDGLERRQLYPVMRAIYSKRVHLALGPNWRVATEEEAVEASQGAGKRPLPYGDSMCCHCETLLQDPQMIMVHMKDAHGLEECTPDDIILHVDSQPDYLQHNSVILGPLPDS
ncbi:hypothetical protein AAF712_002643 [Marasmius tenuissimus]|uniref:C2H2-type domain-containing protein n=1 Tax=Marasmius tenuissimus TaxID=585030 RepID=A0ABR3A8X0_9AGAR